MQRLHTKDLTGHLLEGADGERWEHLCIPMEAPAHKVYIFPVSKKEYVREEGELLNPAAKAPRKSRSTRNASALSAMPANFNNGPCPRVALSSRVRI